jgi:hypothetical protein
MSRVDVVEAAAIRAQLLDGFLAGDWASGDRLHLAGQGVGVGAGGQVLNGPTQDEYNGHHDADRYQQAKGNS